MVHVVLLEWCSVGDVGRAVSNIPGVLVQEPGGLALGHVPDPSSSWQLLGVAVSLVGVDVSSMTVAKVAISIDSITMLLGVSIAVVLVAKSRIPEISVMVPIHSMTVQAVRVDQVAVVVGNLTAQVEARTIPVGGIDAFRSIAMGIGSGLQAVMEGGSSGVGRLHLVEVVGPLGVVEVAHEVPGGGVGGLQLHQPS